MGRTTGSSGGGVAYNYATGSYTDAGGNEVPWYEVYNNYILPNASKYSNVENAQKIWNNTLLYIDGYIFYNVTAFGKTYAVCSRGPLGSITPGTDGSINFSNPTAMGTDFVSWGIGNSQGVHNISDEGLAFIASWEQEPNGGVALSAYDAGDGEQTIEWGHVIKKGENFSGGITLTQANKLLASDVRGTVSTMNRLVTVPLNQNQFDALTSYVFNTGSLSGTKLLLNLNQGNYPGAMKEMDIVTSGGIFMQGLLNRREAEWNIWGNGIYINH